MTSLADLPASNVKDKRVLITGGASGIGAASALLLARRGARVVIADLAEEKGLDIAKIGQEAGDRMSFHQVDVTDGTSVQALFDYSVKELGGLDVVVNNAGVDHSPLPMHEISDDDFERTMAVNVKGVWYCMRAAIGVMAPNGGGHIINIASIAGLHSAPTLSVYSASKHAVMGLTRTAAAEYARVNIRCNAVCPSFIDTPMVRDTLAGMTERQQQGVIKASPMRRLGQIDEISGAIAWLASDESSFMNGHAFTLDGGMLA